MNRESAFFVILILTLLVFSITVSVGVSQDPRSCSPVKGWDFCVKSIELKNQKTFSGQSQVVDTNIQNVGERAGTIVVILSVRDPQGDPFISKSKNVGEISTHETKKATFLVKIPADAVEGEYEVSAIVMSPTSTHTFDSSGYYNTFIVENPNIVDEIILNIEEITIIAAIITILSCVVGVTRWGMKNDWWNTD